MLNRCHLNRNMISNFKRKRNQDQRCCSIFSPCAMYYFKLSELSELSMTITAKPLLMVSIPWWIVWVMPWSDTVINHMMEENMQSGNMYINTVINTNKKPHLTIVDTKYTATKFTLTHAECFPMHSFYWNCAGPWAIITSPNQFYWPWAFIIFDQHSMDFNKELFS